MTTKFNAWPCIESLGHESSYKRSYWDNCWDLTMDCVADISVIQFPDKSLLFMLYKTLSYPAK